MFKICIQESVCYYCILLQRSTSFRTEHESNKLNDVVSCAPLHAKKVLKITLKANWRVVSVHKHNFFSGGCFYFCKFLNSAFKDNVFFNRLCRIMHLSPYTENKHCFHYSVTNLKPLSPNQVYVSIKKWLKPKRQVPLTPVNRVSQKLKVFS